MAQVVTIKHAQCEEARGEIPICKSQGTIEFFSHANTLTCNIDNYDSDLPADAEPIGRQPQIVTIDVAHENVTECHMRAMTGVFCLRQPLPCPLPSHVLTHYAPCVLRIQW